jgi:hypothetical protein
VEEGKEAETAYPFRLNERRCMPNTTGLVVTVHKILSICYGFTSRAHLIEKLCFSTGGFYKFLKMFALFSLDINTLQYNNLRDNIANFYVRRPL